MSARHRNAIVWLALVMLGCAAGCAARETVFQNGVSPSPEYAGCTDTWISGEQYEQGRDSSASAELRCGGKRHILIRFDLTAIPADHQVHQAVLRVADMGYPTKDKEGKWTSALLAYRVASAWNDKASWDYHARKDARDKPADAAWKTPGGDLDQETDFGVAPKGAVAAGRLADGPWGHAHELDVTAIVRRWHAGELANHGLALVAAPNTPGCAVASSEWYVPASRPKLIVAHAPKGAEAATIAPLAPAPKEIELDPVAKTPGAAPIIDPPPIGIVRVGQNANCHLRGDSTDAYVKDAAARYPGTWGWMDMCRVGGRAGDVSGAMLYFDLKGIPPNAQIAGARLVLSLTPWTNRHAGSYRYGAYLLRLPDAPGWKDDQVTSQERLSGKGWPGGSVLACSADKPVAVGTAALKPDPKRPVAGTMEFDLSGAVRAWLAGKVPNCGIVLDNRIEGGAYDFYSSRSFKPDLRPYLEITLVGNWPFPEPKAIQAEADIPSGDYWVEPMKKVHATFKGKPGTLAQYGDSITVTYAFLAYRFAKGAPKDITPPREELALPDTPPEVKKELQAVADYSDRTLWWKWKGPEWGCTGQMRSDWLFANIDGWQKKMNPETAVIMFGTNDRGGICPPEYTEYMAASVKRMLADGTVPILTTIPPPADDSYRLAILAIARGLKVPVIDYNAEMYRRRGDDWSGKKDPPGLISEDGTHPSHPGKYLFTFSEEALNRNGYLLRDYMTIRKYYEVITKVLKAEAK